MVDEDVVEQFRANGGRIGGAFAQTPTILVRHRGARSGAARVTPLACHPLGDGRGSMRAALVYQHATGERDRLIADRLSVLVESSEPPSDHANDDGSLHASCTDRRRPPPGDQVGGRFR